jgi:phosphoribosylaminoimidazole (AIR) synthetase
MAVICAQAEAAKLCSVLQRHGESANIIGRLVTQEGGERVRFSSSLGLAS